MATLNIEGRRVTVDDAFLNLSPDEQNRTVEEIAASMGIGASSTAKFADALRQEAPSQNIEDQTQPQQPSALANYAGRVADRVHSVARGLPGVGSYMDEVAAGLNTGFGFLGDYTQARDKQRARDKAYDEAHPIESNVGKGIGVIGSAAATLPYAAATLPASILARMGIGSATAGGLGFVEGYGRGEGDAKERLRSARDDAITGGAIGFVAPVVGAAVGKVAKWGYKAWQELGKKLAGMPSEERKAMTAMLRQLEDSGMSVDDAERRIRELGPASMLADVAPPMQKLTGQISAADNAASRTITDRLVARRQEGGQRVGQALDAAFGRASDPYAVDAARKSVSRQLAPEYAAAWARSFDPTNVVADLSMRIEKARGPLQQKLKQVRSLLVDTDPATGLPRLINTGELAHKARMSLDDMVDSVNIEPSIGRHAKRELTEIRAALDHEMKAQIPEFAGADTRYAAAAGRQDAFNYGREELFKGGPSTPSPMAAAAELRSMPVSERDMVRQGARFELERQTSNARRNPGFQAESALSRDFNDDKARLLIGRRRADELGNRLKAEETFTTTSNLGEPGRGSRTAMIASHQGFAGLANELGAPTVMGAATLGPKGAAAGLVTGIVTKLSRMGMTALADKAARTLMRAEANLLTAQGAERDAIIQELRRTATEIRRAGDVESATAMLGYLSTVASANRASVPSAAQSYLPR